MFKIYEKNELKKTDLQIVFILLSNLNRTQVI